MHPRIETGTYDFRYGCEGHEIDLRTLLYSQEFYLGLLHELNRELFPNQHLSIKVKAIEPGSFVVSQLVEISVVTGTLVFSTGPLSELFQAVDGFFQIMRIMARHNGEQPRELPAQHFHIVNHGILSGNITLNFANGESSQVNERLFKVYKRNQTADDCARNLSEAICIDPQVADIKVIEKTSGQTVWHMNREEFRASRTTNPYLEPSEVEEMHEDERIRIVTVIRPDLSGEHKDRWGIICEGKKIEAVEMLDTAFKARIRGKELRFGYADDMKVRIRVMSVWNTKKRQYTEKRHSILEVLEFPMLSKQTEMPF